MSSYLIDECKTHSDLRSFFWVDAFIALLIARSRYMVVVMVEERRFFSCARARLKAIDMIFQQENIVISQIISFFSDAISYSMFFSWKFFSYNFGNKYFCEFFIKTHSPHDTSLNQVWVQYFKQMNLCIWHDIQNKMLQKG